MKQSKLSYNQRHPGVNANQVWLSTRVGLTIIETGGLTGTSGICPNPSFLVPGLAPSTLSHGSGAQLSCN